jgi:hypothetical protein
MKIEAIIAASLRPVGYSWSSGTSGSGGAIETSFSPWCDGLSLLKKPIAIQALLRSLVSEQQLKSARLNVVDGCSGLWSRNVE